MNVLFSVFGLLAIIVIAIMGIIGANKKRMSIVTLALMFALLLSGVLIALHAKPADSREYRVVYSKGSSIVVVDDENGKTKRYNLDGIIHEDASYDVGDYVTVVVTGTADTVYIAPSEHNVVVPEKNPKK